MSLARFVFIVSLVPSTLFASIEDRKYPLLSRIAPQPLEFSGAAERDLTILHHDFKDMIARTEALDHVVDARVAALWTRQPGAKAAFWRQARLEVERAIRILGVTDARAERLRERLYQLSRDVVPQPGAKFAEALRLDAELLARTLERLGETSREADIDARLVDAIKIISHAHVLIGRGTPSILRRSVTCMMGRSYDVRHFEHFWHEVRRNLSFTTSTLGDGAADARAISGRVGHALRARGSIEAACDRALTH